MARFLRIGLLGIASFGILFFGLWLFSLLGRHHQSDLSVGAKERPIIAKLDHTNQATKIEHLQDSRMSSNESLNRANTTPKTSNIEISEDNHNTLSVSQSNLALIRQTDDGISKSNIITNTRSIVEIPSDVKNTVPTEKNDTKKESVESVLRKEPVEEVVVMAARSRQTRSIESLEKASKGNKVTVRVPRRE